MNCPINHPLHYCAHPSQVECIRVTGDMSFCVGNAFKYLYRCSEKGNTLEDLKKALWYIEFELKRREPLWFKYCSEQYDARHDGPRPIMAILTHESRFCGHMASALERLYTAYVYPRSVCPLRHARGSVERMIKIYEYQH